MKQKTIAMLAALFCVAALPLTAWADSQSFTPPPRSGKIYVIIRHRSSFPPSKTNITVRWGGWSKSGTFDAAGFRYSREGVVIKLDHKKNDSIPLTVSTSGTIVSIYQGDPPRQNPVWEYVNW